MPSDDSTKKKPKFTSVKVPHLDPKERTTCFDECSLGYTEEEAIEEASRCLNCKNRACVKACPVAFPIPEFLGLVREGKKQDAYELFLGYALLPRSLSRICGIECSNACTLGKKGEGINVAAVKRFISDSAITPDWFYDKKATTGKKVAIIGSGPAGLVSAIELAKIGHDVTIFEKEIVYGGMLALAIPEFRLPKQILNDEIIPYFDKLNIKFEKEKILGRDFKLNELKEEFDAILIAIGAHASKNLDIPGEECEGVIEALSLLKDINLCNEVDIGHKIGIIGGGNTAVDAARSCRRLGSDVTIYYRRTRKEMPANFLSSNLRSTYISGTSSDV